MHPRSKMKLITPQHMPPCGTLPPWHQQAHAGLACARMLQNPRDQLERWVAPRPSTPIKTERIHPCTIRCGMPTVIPVHLVVSVRCKQVNIETAPLACQFLKNSRVQHVVRTLGVLRVKVSHLICLSGHPCGFQHDVMLDAVPPQRQRALMHGWSHGAALGNHGARSLTIRLDQDPLPTQGALGIEAAQRLLNGQQFLPSRRPFAFGHPKRAPCHH
mmetsp:Transcript_21941/g.55834  ORF Transcript_21941/g.55834 Transcript_21941/m.55834 type:complete len:216 (-) Transcript_21941:1750-2397(-)